MSKEEKISWEEFKKKLEEKGYLEAEKGSFFFNFSLKSLSFPGSLLRLSTLFSFLSSFVLSLIITLAISYFQKKFLPLLFLYYFPIFFILFFGIIPLANFFMRIRHIKSPSLFSFNSGIVLSLFCSILLFLNFGNLLPKNIRFSLFFISIALFFLIFFPAFRVLSLLSWREIPYKKLKKIHIYTILILIILSFFGLFLFFSKKDHYQEKVAIQPEHHKLAVLAIDGLPLKENFLEEISLKEILENSFVFEMKIEEYKSPPVFWTEVSTGFPPEANGLLNLKSYKLPLIKKNIYPLPLSFFLEKISLAKESLSTSGARKKRTFWEISSLYGRHTISLNWWASWEPLEESGELISNLYYIKALNGEKGREYKLIEPIEIKNENLPRGYKWNKIVFDTLLEKVKDQDLVSIYYPGIDVQMEEIKKGDPENIFENSKYLEENLKIIKKSLEFLKEKNYKILFLSYSGRMKEVWGWGFLYPNEKNMKKIEGVSIHSISPTILKILNLPLSKKFPQKPLSLPFEEFEPQYIEDYPPAREEKTFFSPPPLEELKSLGYIQ